MTLDGVTDGVTDGDSQDVSFFLKDQEIAVRLPRRGRRSRKKLISTIF